MSPQRPPSDWIVPPAPFAGQINLVAYDPTWPAQYEAVAARIRAAIESTPGYPKRSCANGRRSDRNRGGRKFLSKMIASVERFGWIDHVDHSIRAHIEYLR